MGGGNVRGFFNLGATATMEEIQINSVGNGSDQVVVRPGRCSLSLAHQPSRAPVGARVRSLDAMARCQTFETYTGLWLGVT